jgi:hypothetical protein
VRLLSSSACYIRRHSLCSEEKALCGDCVDPSICVCVCVCGLASIGGCFGQEFANKDEFCEHLVQGQLYLVQGYKLLSACLSIVNDKVKFTHKQAMKAQRGSRGIALLFL